MKRIFAAAVAAVALAFPVGLVAQSGQQGGQSGQSGHQSGQVGTTGAVAAASVNDIVDNPEEYYGERVTVSGGVGEVFGGQLFNIEEEGVLDVDDQLLVLLPKKHEQAVTDDSTVQVTGMIRKFVREDIERDYGITDWGAYGLDDDDDFFDTYNEKPILIADAIDIRR